MLPTMRMLLAIACTLTASCSGGEAVQGPDALHKSSLVFDGHNDLLWQIREQADYSFDKLDISLAQPGLHTDLERLAAGGLGAQYWSVYIPADSAQPLQEVTRQIDLFYQLLERYPETFELALDSVDVERIHAAGRIASLIGIEGGNAIQDDLSTLRMLHRLGARYMTLTHADSLAWADSATDDPISGGLSPFGEEVVREMNRLGMLADISHVSVDCMQDVLRVSRAPIMASHSCARALADHVRNVPDEVLQGLPANGGVIMVNFFSGFLVPESAQKMANMFNVRRDLRAQFADDAEYDAAVEEWRRDNPMEPGSLEHLLAHIDHIARVAGIDHVGLGSDYDGVTMLPEGLADVSTYPRITAGLLERGYTPEDVRKVLGENMLRVMREAEKVAREWRD